MIWSFLHHWSAAIQLRASLYIEARRARKEHCILPDGINRKIWKEPHHLEEFIWLLRFVPNTEDVTLIDIGGNSGYWAEEFMRFYPKTISFGFEPVEDMFNLYTQRFSENKNVTVFHTALGDTIEEKVINVAKDYGLTSFNTYSHDLNERNVNFNRQLTVSVNQLNNYISNIPFSDSRKTIIKVDVQGFEVNVVRGGLNVFEKADVVIMECSFINEYKLQLPTFGELVHLFRQVGLHPVRFGVFDRTKGPIAYERNVLFIKEKYFKRIWN